MAELERELGTWLPAAEVIFLPRLPLRVDEVAVPRGSTIEGTFLTVSGSELVLRGSVTERDAPLVEEGMGVEIENPASGGAIGAWSLSRRREPGPTESPRTRFYIEIEAEEILEEMVGRNVRVTIPVSSTGGEVLAVPAAALSATADGSTIVQVEGKNSRLRTVTVEPGLAAEGLVEVTPIEGDLAEGDLVVVGREQQSATAEADGDS